MDAPSTTAAVAFWLRCRVPPDEPWYFKARRVADIIGCTSKQLTNALRDIDADDGLAVERWSGEGTYPSTWVVRRAE
jgi:hypothetical protein